MNRAAIAVALPLQSPGGMTIFTRRTSFAIAAVLGAITTATPALADDSATKLTELIDKLAYNLGGTLGDPKWTDTVTTMAEYPDPKTCYDAAAAAKTAGTTTIHAGGKDMSMTDVEAFCTRYDDIIVHESVEAALVDTFQYKHDMEAPVEGQYEVEAQRVGISGANCAKWVDAALAHGIAATEVIESPRYKMPGVELGKAKATMCQPAIDFATKRVDEINHLAQSKQDEIAAIYKAAGFKGKKLELFVSYGKPEDAGFLAAGCETWVESIGAIKKAKKLFVWLEGDAGYTIRKFTFKGNTYSVSEHTYSTKEGAYAGCR